MRALILILAGLSVTAASMAAAADQSDREERGVMQEGKVQRDGFDLYYRIAGKDGPFVVLLSGGPGADVRHMLPVAEEVSRTHRAVLLEQRGTGRSTLTVYDSETISLDAYVADIEALRRHLKEDRLILIGNSWGMALALAYGVFHPAHTKAIITLGSGPLSLDHARAMQDNVLARLDTEERTAYDASAAKFAQGSEAAFWEMMRLQWPVFFFDREKGRAAFAHFTPGDMNLDVMTRSGPLLTAVAERVAPRLERITAPVLLVQGRQDPAPEAHIVEIANRLPKATLKLLHRCGHEPWIDQPDETWRLVRNFLRDLGP